VRDRIFDLRLPLRLAVPSTEPKKQEMTLLIPAIDYTCPETDLPRVLDRIRALMLDAVSLPHTKAATPEDSMTSWYGIRPSGLGR